MTIRPTPTGYARLGRKQARLVLVAWLLVAAFCVGVTVSPLAKGMVGKRAEGKESDLALYWAEVDRVRAGEGFYEASAREVPGRGYPTLSVFNWRTPLPMWLLGKMPVVVLGKALLGILALALIVMAYEALARQCPGEIRRAVYCGLLMTGPLMFCILGGLFVLPGLWAGVFIALSICAYGLDRRYLGVAMGLAAVFFRELALPYCLLAAAIAWWARRRGELRAWFVGLAAWAAFYLLHVIQVAAIIPSDGWALSQSWIQFGGAAFVISTAQVNAYLLLLPQWVTALYFVAAMIGFAGWHTSLGLRATLTVCLFVICFSLVGQETNQYWGTLIAPLFCLGLAQLPASLSDLWNAAAWTMGTARRRSPDPAETVDRRSPQAAGLT